MGFDQDPVFAGINKTVSENSGSIFSVLFRRRQEKKEDAKTDERPKVVTCFRIFSENPNWQTFCAYHVRGFEEVLWILL